MTGKNEPHLILEEQKNRKAEYLPNTARKKPPYFPSERWQNLMPALKKSNLHELKVASERRKNAKLTNTIQITIA